MNVTSKVHLQHSKVHQMFPVIQICLLFVPIGVNTSTCWLQHEYNIRNFYIKTTRYSCLLDDEYKFKVNASDKTAKSPKYIIL